MCGIVGVVQRSSQANDFPLDACLKGLKRLEYRGYDSAGVALAGEPSFTEGMDLSQTLTIPGIKVQVRKKAGRLDNLREEIQVHPTFPASVAIAHTRWATHGKASDSNAHPHTSNDARIALIHNGIIENASQIREELEASGTFFTSATDTEVAVHLLRKELENVEREGFCAQGEGGVAKTFGSGLASLVANQGDSQDKGLAQGGDFPPNENFSSEKSADARASKYALTEAMRRVAKLFRGTFTLLAIDAVYPEVVVGARHDSPLVIGLGDGVNYLGSDVAAFVDQTKRAIFVDQDQLVTLTADSVELIDFDGRPQSFEEFEVNWDATAASKGGYQTFMEKEIREEPRAVADTLLGRLDGHGNLQLDDLKMGATDFAKLMRSIDKIIVIACGTAAYAGHVAKYAIEHWCRIPVEIELAHEFRYRDPIVNGSTLVISISQSGETMDTLMAVRHACEQGARTISICNTQGASIARESDAVLYTHAGPEVAVASTKAFVAQITAAYLIGLYLAQIRGNKFQDEVGAILDELHDMPDKIQSLVDQFDAVVQLAKELHETSSVLFLGRHVGFPVAMEGALKLKELAYIHAEGFAAGELKHGPIALIDEGQPVFVILPPPSREELHAKVISNIQEVRARGAQVFTIAEEGDKQAFEQASAVFTRPTCPSLFAPLLDVVPLQIFAYALATFKGLDVDQPRNLAKSVTVE